MHYENPMYKKTKGSRCLIVACAHCQTDIARYDKVGPGGLLRMYVNRIVKSAADLSQRGLFCPGCERQLGAKTYLRQKNVEAYRLIRGACHVRACD